jgi:phosphonate transport system ATP-binding protein
MPSPTRAALRVQGVSQAYGRRVVLDGANVHVPAGTSLALLGANGSGKTTLLRIAAGLRTPQSGSAHVGDVPAPRASREGRIGYIPQHLGLVRHATVLQNACLGASRAWPWWRTVVGIPPPAVRERAKKALAAVGLEHRADALARELSGGERQRTAIARTLVQRPDVLVADELVASLDIRQARQVLHLLDGLKQSGCTILASLHQVEAAVEWADRVSVLVQGRPTPPRAAADVTAEEVRWLVAG